MKTLNRSFGFLIVVILFFAAAVQNTTADEDKEAIQQLKDAGKSASVEEQLNEPDGVAIDGSDPGNIKLFVIGSAVYGFNNSPSIENAKARATDKAYGKIAEFADKTTSQEEKLDKLTKHLIKQNTAEGLNATESDNEKVRESIESFTGEVGTSGWISISTKAEWMGKSGLVKVTLGQSQKTMKGAKTIINRNADLERTRSGAKRANEKESSKPSPKIILEKSKSDF